MPSRNPKSQMCSQIPQAHTGALEIHLSRAECPDCVCAAAGLEPNEASNSQIIFNHFFNWRRMMELQ